MSKVFAGYVWLVPFSAALCATPDSGDFTTSILPVLAQNCAACHNSKKPDVDFLKAQTAKDIEANRRLWHSVAEQLRNRSMPPVASKITEQERLLVATWVDNQLRATACNIGDYAGPVAERRLNRREYHNTVRDLLGIDVAASDLFPADGTGGAGFDTNGETLYIPPLLMERYLQSAQQLLDRVIVSPLVNKTFTPAEFVPLREGASAPPALAVGDEAAVTIPAYLAGDYTVRVMSGPGDASGVKLELKIDGAPAGDLVQEPQRGFGGGAGRGRVPAPRPLVLKVKLDRGPHVVTVRAASAASVASIAVEQESAEASPEKRALHYHLLGLEPGDEPIQPRKAAQQVLATFLPKAWRRPVQASDIDRFLALFDRSAARGDPWEESVKLALKGVLVSPDFLFRVEDRKEKPGLYPVGQYEMATRLSYFLWSTMPDDQLLRLAEQGRLQDPKVLTAQVDRMLGDSRSRVFTRSFIGQWLGTQDLGGKVMPFVNQLTPNHYTPESAADLRAEPVMLFDRLLGENRSLLELLTADYTYMTPRLAQFYGVEDKVKIQGDSFQLVKWPDDRRAGILGMGATLAITSQRLETHPVLRGAWVLDTLLGTPVPPPPPGVPPLPSDKGKTGNPSVRAKLELHRGNQICSTCHNLMDPIGFGLENFDGLGQWRDKDSNGNAIDAAGKLPSGEQFNGPVELRQALLAKKDDFIRQVTGKILGYALGRSLQDGDSCTVQRITDAIARDGYKAGTLIHEIVLSVPFRNTQGGTVPLETKTGAPVYRKERIIPCTEDGTCTPLKKPDTQATADTAAAKPR